MNFDVKEIDETESLPLLSKNCSVKVSTVSVRGSQFILDPEDCG